MQGLALVAGRSFAPIALGLACWTAQASAYVYWANSGGNSIGRAQLNGVGLDPNYIVGAGRPDGLAISGGYIYWANRRGDHGNGSIGRESLAGGPADESFISALTPYGLAVSGQYVYWAESGENQIGRAKLDGTQFTVNFISGASVPFGVAVEGGHIYWTNYVRNTIGRADLDGTHVDENFITGARRPFAIAVDAKHVYWTNDQGATGSIGRAKLDGTGVKVAFIAHAGVKVGLTQGARNPVGITADAHHIYWTDHNSRAIARANLSGTEVRLFIGRVSLPSAVAVSGIPPWTLTLTALPATGTIGTPASITAVTNNLLAGTHDYINIFEGTTLLKKCKTTTCRVSSSPGEGVTTYSADVGPADTMPSSTAAVVSTTTTADRTPPNCPGGNCT